MGCQPLVLLSSNLQLHMLINFRTYLVESLWLGYVETPLGDNPVPYLWNSMIERISRRSYMYVYKNSLCDWIDKNSSSICTLFLRGIDELLFNSSCLASPLISFPSFSCLAKLLQRFNVEWGMSFWLPKDLMMVLIVLY